MLFDLIGTDLKSGYDKIVALKKTPGYSQEELQEVYKTDILPYLLQLRHQNRKEKDELEEKSSKIKELYEQLRDLQQMCDSLSFMASCLESQAAILDGEPANKSTTTHIVDIKDSNTTNDSFDLNAVSKLDHETRMQLLDEEEKKRKELQTKLIEINAETKIFELTCSQTTSHLNEVKPHIKLLLEKVGPTIQQVEQTNLIEKLDQ